MKPVPPQSPIIHIGVIESDPLRLVGLHSILDPLPTLRLRETTLSAVKTDQTVDLVLLGNSDKLPQIISDLKVARPDLPVIVTGIGVDDENILKAVCLGAKGFVDETASTVQLAQAIHAVFNGMIWFPRRVISVFIERSRHVLSQTPQSPSAALTAREKQVLQMLVEGRTNKEIAIPLGIVERTVKAHIAKLMRKIGVQNRIALTVQAVRQSLTVAAQ